jgi:carotenoid 1,2-hydratase
MTERSALSVQQGEDYFVVGPSQLSWQNNKLVVQINERSIPWLTRVIGQVVVHTENLCTEVFALDDRARHLWGPIAPAARVEVKMFQPDLSWEGHAYLDSNEGVEPIDEGFKTWDWARGNLATGESAVVYDVRPKRGPDRLISVRFDEHLQAQPMQCGTRQALPASGWRIDRQVQSQEPAKLISTFEDTPFYARSVVQTQWQGETVTAMHETLDTGRLVSPVVQRLLPFKMPRAG